MPQGGALRLLLRPLPRVQDFGLTVASIDNTISVLL